MAQSRYLRLRLFLEGIEVDVVSAQVQCGINIPASASVQIPAITHALEFLPRTLVHLFFFDVGFNSATAGLGADATVDIADLRNWRLLFAGEILSFDYVNMGGARHIALRCQDFSSYWDMAKLYWGGSRKSSFQNQKRAIFAGATHLHKGKDIKSDPIINILQRTPVSIPGLPGLLGGIVSLLETTTGVYDAPAATSKTGKSAKNFRGTNDFMSQAELRLRLTRMIGASPHDDSSAAFIKSASFRRYFRKISSAVKSTASFMQLVDVLLGRIYHRYSSVAAPPYLADGQKIKTKVRKVKDRMNFSGNADISAIFKAVVAAELVVGNRITDREDSVAREEPVLVGRDGMQEIQVPPELTSRPDTAGHLTFNAAIRATRILSFSREFLTTTGKNGVDAARGKGQTAGRTARGTARGLTIIGDAIDTLRLVTNSGTGVEEAFRKHTFTNLNNALRDLNVGKAQLKAISSTTFTTVEKEIELSDRLNMFLFHPDIYMVPPPKCNVIFPDHYSSIKFSRNWLSEITRLWMFGRSESGKDKKDLYFAPNISMIGVPGVETAKDAVNKGASFIMKHEKFTGIIPTFQGLGDNDIFKKLHKREIKEDAKADGDGSKVAGRARFTPQEHLQRAANFLFFSKRFASRNMVIGGRFMPQLVAGLPALILDPDTRQYNATGAFAKSSGTHFIGTIDTLTHVLNAQGGASTHVNLTKCRTHVEGLDLFGDQEEGEVVRKVRRTVSKKLKAGRGKDFVAAFAGTFDDGFAKTENIRPEAIVNFVPVRGTRYAIVAKDHRQGGFARQGPSLPDPLADQADGHRTVFADVDGTGSITGDTRDNRARGLVVDIVQTKTVTTEKKFTFSLEDTLTPPWFAQIYRRTRIGSDYYQPMIGCFSILDDALIALPKEEQQAVDVAKAPPQAVADAANALNFLRGLPLTAASASVKIPIKAADGSVFAEVDIPAELTEVSTTSREAAEVLARVWLGLRQVDANVDLFIESYVARKFASIEDIMGTKNPFFFPRNRFGGSTGQFARADVVGFHGNAYGNFSSLENVDAEPLNAEALQQGINDRGESKEISPSIDPRAERRTRVLAYINELFRISTASSEGASLGGR